MRKNKAKLVVLATVAATLSILLSQGPSAAKTYRNREFGIVLTAPTSLQVCAHEEASHQHGFNILLDRNLSNCDDPLHHRVISLFAFYNVTTDTATLDELLQWTCKEVLNAPCIRPPRGLRFREHASAAGEVRFSNGLVSITVVTQNNTMPTPLNYVATLTTDGAHTAQDLRVFSEVLRGIRIVPPH